MAKKREEFDGTCKWNVSDLFKSDFLCKKELKELKRDCNKLLKYKGHILDSSNSLYELLELDKDLSIRLEKAFLYAHLNNDADTTNTTYQELYGLAKNIYTNYLEVSSFIVPELLQNDKGLVDIYIKENKLLKPYKRMLKDIYRNKKHVLNSECESILSSLASIINSSDDTFGTLVDTDFKFDDIIIDGERKELNESNFSVYLKDNNQKVRKQAFENIYKTYSNFKNTIAQILKNEIEKNVQLSKIRHFKNSLDRSLFANQIDRKVYINLIDSVHNNLDSIYKYWELKKKLLHLDELHIYDTYTSIGTSSTNTYDFSKAKDLILKSLQPLGDNYINDISKSFSEGWIDYCNNEGKRKGAYCTCAYNIHPYVLMSYENTLDDVSTLAHELGHAMHYYYACKHQNYQDYNYSIFVAEVASQVNEILLSRYLLDNSKNNNEKIKIIDDLLQKYKSTIYRQTMFAEFELFIHEYTEKGGVLTSEVLCNKYLELNRLYFGKSVFVDEEIKYEWERIPHFYMNFYVYQYATGFAAAVNLANEIYNGNENVRDNYLKFLRLGSTKNPIDSLKVAGIDTTNNTFFDNAINYMDELIKEYEKLKEVKTDE